MRLLISVPILLALCSCGSGAEKAQLAGKTSTSAKADGPRVGKDTVMVIRKAMGRWRSSPGVLPGSRNQWLLLDISGTKDVSLEVHSTDPGRDSVTAFAKGHVVITFSGIYASLPGANGVLTDFRSVSGTFPTTSTLRLKTSNGRQFDLIYDGL